MTIRIVASLAVGLGFHGALRAADPVFSGPQPGEKTTPFKVVVLTGDRAGTERDPIADNDGAPTALVFIHGIERSMVPLVRVVDAYGALRKDSLRTEIVFLAADRLQGEHRVKAVANSLNLQSRVGLSLDGAEGPGNYGLNTECLMTIVTTKDNAAIANFALVQPGIADAPRVLEALAFVSGDPMPPTAEELSRNQQARTAGGGRDGDGMRRDGGEMAARLPLDVTAFDLSTHDGLRGAVETLIGEVRSLRADLDAVRAGDQRPTQRRSQPDQGETKQGSFPGAVPSDATLQGLLRRFIQPTNDEPTVDAVLAEVRTYVKDNATLEQQAIDGWTRVLHFGDRYGTAYARQSGRAFLDELLDGKR